MHAAAPWMPSPWMAALGFCYDADLARKGIRGELRYAVIATV